METVISFIQNHIPYRFGIPETITMKVGKTQERGGVELCFQKLFFLRKITTVHKIRV